MLEIKFSNTMLGGWVLTGMRENRNYFIFKNVSINVFFIEFRLICKFFLSCFKNSILDSPIDESIYIVVDLDEA